MHRFNCVLSLIINSLLFMYSLIVFTFVLKKQFVCIVFVNIKKELVEVF